MTGLGRLADELVDVLAEEDPLNDLLQGYPGLDHRLPDLDEAAGERLRDRAVRIAAAAADLDTDDRVTRGVVVQQAEAVATRVDSRLVEHTVANFTTSPVAILLSWLAEVVPDNAERERDFLTRLAGVPEFLRGVARRHRGGVAAGRVPVESRVRATIAQLDAYLAGSDDPLRRPELTGDRVAERERLLAEVVRPAFAEYRDVLAAQIVQHGRPGERPGLCWLPWSALRGADRRRGARADAHRFRAALA